MATKAKKVVAATPVKVPKKTRRDEMLTMLYAEIEEMLSWLQSARARYNDERIQLGRVLDDIHGAQVAITCGLRDTIGKYPEFFPNAREVLKPSAAVLGDVIDVAERLAKEKEAKRAARKGA
ncbi:MAG: hypothetical protein U1F10_00555 [Burkholderiales bacterium]